MGPSNERGLNALKGGGRICMQVGEEVVVRVSVQKHVFGTSKRSGERQVWKGGGEFNHPLSSRSHFGKCSGQEATCV